MIYKKLKKRIFSFFEWLDTKPHVQSKATSELLKEAISRRDLINAIEHERHVFESNAKEGLNTYQNEVINTNPNHTLILKRVGE